MHIGVKIGVPVLTLAGVGAAIYFVAVVEPARYARKDLDQIDAFGKAWHEVRACIFGETPRSPDLVEALTLREALEGTDAIEVKRCQRLMKGLERPPGDSTGVAAIEDGWAALDKRVAPLASALVWRASDEAYRSARKLRADIAAAVDDLETAYAALRKGAKMRADPPASSKAAPVPAAPEGTVILVGGNQPLVPEEVEAQAGRILVRGRSGGGPELALVRSPTGVEVFSAGEQVLRAAAGAPWGVWTERADDGTFLLHAAALDSAGEPTGAAAVVVDSRKLDREDVLAVRARFALGSGGARVVVVEVQGGDFENQVVVARSRDGGATWKELKVLGPAQVDPSWIRGRVDLTWEAGGALLWLPLDEATADRTLVPQVLIPEVQEAWIGRRPCVSPSYVWWATIGGALRVGPGGAQEVADAPREVDHLACDDEQMVTSRERLGRIVVTRCNVQSCSEVGSHPAGASQLVMSIGPAQGLVVATVVDRYLLLWRGDAPTPALRFDADVQVPALVEWEGAFHALVTEPQRARLVPLPR